jgi:hypothetical protein
MENKNIITRKEAIKKIGNYSKYAALTAMSTYIMLHPKSAQASSALPVAPSDNSFEDF